MTDGSETVQYCKVYKYIILDLILFFVEEDFRFLKLVQVLTGR